jgi:hypothetical protein
MRVDLEERLRSQLEGVRTFESGATRHDDPNRVDWLRMMSLPVLFEYARYMRAHREQPDGSRRDFDNWKLGIPQDQVVESLFRHVLDLAALHSGMVPMRDCGKREACCAIMFNVMAYLHNLIESGVRAVEDDPPVGG